jgi:Rps23 Pro-64 3,4-dihydroxylase Tpa1-like proline 4-hydroxylase
MWDLDADQLYANLKTHANSFANATPFPHLVIDDWLPEAWANTIAADFPDGNAVKWNVHGSGANSDDKLVSGTKLQYSDVNTMPFSLRAYFYAVNSPRFIKYLSEISGQEHIITDPFLSECGMHSTGRGGRLMIHSDINRYPVPGITQQYLNAIYYCNKIWLNSWGGELEFWDKNAKQCVKKIEPRFNRLVIFLTDRYSYHGHPHPLTCPDNIRRNSLATYYYIPLQAKALNYTDNYISVIWKRTNEHDKVLSRKYILYKVQFILSELLPPLFFKLILLATKRLRQISK